MIFQNKDLTHCPDRCQTCKNYQMLELNRTEFFNHLYDKSNNLTCDSVGYDGYCYGDEEEYHLNQQLLYIDDDNNYYSGMPWEMEFFYQYAHCARDLSSTPSIWKTGDNNKMYETIVRDFPMYSPTVLSRPSDSAYAREMNDYDTSVGVGPWVVQLEDLLTDEECDAMINQTKIAIDGSIEDGWSILATDEETDTASACQSTQAWCDPKYCMQDPILKGTWKKIEELVGLPFDTHSEAVHFIQYVPGQKYGRHTDAIKEEFNSMYGPRLFTLLLYLNDVDESNGGETCFPQIQRSDGSDGKICIQPKKGRAVIWPNIMDEIPGGTVEIAEDRTYHEASGIQEGHKYASTIWYHLRNFSYAESVDCTAIYTDAYQYDQRLFEENYANDDEYSYDLGDDDSYFYDDDDDLPMSY